MHNDRMILDAWLVAGLTAAVFATVLWLVSLLMRDSSIVDAFWASASLRSP